MKSAIVFLQTLLFTWESVWKKNEFEKSSILEIFHKYGILKSNKILIFSFKSDTKWVTEFMKQVSCISLLLYMYYECPKLPIKNCHFLICEGENLGEKRFVKSVFQTCYKILPFQWESSNFEVEIINGKVAPNVKDVIETIKRGCPIFFRHSS